MGTPGDVNTCCYPAVVASKLPPSISLDSVCSPCGDLQTYLHMYVLSRRIARSQVPVLQRVTYRVGGFSARTVSLPAGSGSARRRRLGLGLRKEPTPQFPPRPPWVVVVVVLVGSAKPLSPRCSRTELRLRAKCKEERVQSRHCGAPPSRWPGCE